MKYEEKQLQRKLKRRICVMSAVALMLLAIEAITWNVGHILKYCWQVNPVGGYNTDSIGLLVGHGGISVVFRQERDVVLINPKAVVDVPLGWRWVTAPNNIYPYVGNGSDGVRFAGFELCRAKRSWVRGQLTNKTTDWGAACPIVVFLIGPICLIVISLIRMQSTGRKPSAFPVEFPNTPSAKGENP